MQAPLLQEEKKKRDPRAPLPKAAPPYSGELGKGLRWSRGERSYLGRRNPGLSRGVFFCSEAPSRAGEK